MNFKKVYSKAVQGYALVMTAVDFYKEHKEEIDSIAKRIGEYAKSVKNSVFKPKLIDEPDFASMGYTREDVEAFIEDKDVVTVGEYMERFGIDVLNPKIVFDWLIARGIAIREKPGTYRIIKKGVDA